MVKRDLDEFRSQPEIYESKDTTEKCLPEVFSHQGEYGGLD
jgi:hypothetical protein